MRRKALIMLFALAIANMHAQIDVLPSGQSVFGSAPRVFDRFDHVEPEFVSAVFTSLIENPRCSYISFGSPNSAGIGAMWSKSYESPYKLHLYSDAGLDFTIRNISVCKFIPEEVPEFVFNSVVRAHGYIVSSDERLKQDIVSIDKDYTLLSELNTVKYHLNEDIKSLSEKNNEDFREFVDTKRLRYGFIAQEVKEIFPNLVYEDASGYLGIDYIGLIPLLIDAYKDVCNRLYEIEYRISAVNDEKDNFYFQNALLSQAANNHNYKSYILQNHPNPFNSASVVNYVIDNNVDNAFINIYDLSGNEVFSVQINDRIGSLEIDAYRLHPGMYLYSLITDGIEIDTKRMIITK